MRKPRRVRCRRAARRLGEAGRPTMHDACLRLCYDVLADVEKKRLRAAIQATRGASLPLGLPKTLSNLTCTHCRRWPGGGRKSELFGLLSEAGFHSLHGRSSRAHGLRHGSLSRWRARVRQLTHSITRFTRPEARPDGPRGRSPSPPSRCSRRSCFLHRLSWCDTRDA